MKKNSVMFRLILLIALFNLLKMNEQINKLFDIKNIEELNHSNQIDFTFATEKIHKIIKRQSNLDKFIKNLKLQKKLLTSSKGILYAYY